MIAIQLDEQIPDWKDGSHARAVEQWVLREWFGDDFNDLRVMLRDAQYADEFLQLFLALPWCAAKEYYRVFGAYMTAPWSEQFQLFLNAQEPAIISVIGESVDTLTPGKLRTIASDFNRAVWDFRMSYGVMDQSS